MTNKVTWRNVHGPMQATMLTLHRLGWKIPSADMWITPCGNAMANLGSSQSGAKEQILKAVGETAREKGWKEAASHFMGGGLEQGVPALRPAKEARDRLARVGKLEAATALEAVVCGGSWPDGREGTVRLCPCGARDTALHKFWTCPLLDQFTEEEVVKSQWMKKGVEAGDYEECLWGRAILPAGKIEGGVEVDPKEVEVRMTGLFGVVAERTSTIYTDGSGGSAKSSKQCPRHGSGAAAVNLQHDDEGKWTVTEVELMASSVPGRQTVPRAELWAAGAGIKATRGEERIEVKSDAKYVVEGWKAMGKARENQAAGRNADLWQCLRGEVAGRRGGVGLTKVKAHLTAEDVVDSGKPVDDFVGNILADAAAGAAADWELNKKEEIRRTLMWEKRAYFIACRLGVIEARAWAKEPSMVPPPDPLPEHVPRPTRDVAVQIANKVEGHGHLLVKLYNDSTMCTRCRKRKRKDNFAFCIANRCTRLLGEERRTEEASERASTRRRRNAFDDPEGEDEVDEGEGTQFVAGFVCFGP